MKMEKVGYVLIIGGTLNVLFNWKIAYALCPYKSRGYAYGLEIIAWQNRFYSLAGFLRTLGILAIVVGCICVSIGFFNKFKKTK